MTLEFSHKIAALRSTLTAFARRFTVNRDESLDLVQDTILKALTYREKFKEDTNLKGWLFTIMRNTFINNYRKSRRFRTTVDTTQDLYYLNISDEYTFHSPEGTFQYEDIWKNVHEIREELLIPFKMHASGYKYQEIAAHLKIPIGTVKNRIFHARKEIQRKFSK